jgi:RNA polymerase sigma-70 factor (ECF subfamily)
VPLGCDDISQLYGREARELLVFFARRVFDPEAAVDLVGETFASAFEDRHQFRGKSEGEAVGWLYGIARHRLSSYLRRGSVERNAMSRLGVERRELTDPEYERIEELSVTADLRARVRERMEQLAPGLREAVRMRVIEERPYAELAASLGISEQNARARVSRGLRALAAPEASANGTAALRETREAARHD